MFFLLLLTLASSCTLLGGESAGKPKPSLTKCYRYNTSACCVSAHDQSIQEDYSNLLSAQCQREYDFLEDYFCIGCNPTENDFVDDTLKIIKLCKGYAESVWGGDLLLPTTNFDNCGMSTFWRNDVETIIPSAEWANAFQFFWEVKPTYFSDYYVIIYDNSDPDCYSSGLVLIAGIIYLVS